MRNLLEILGFSFLLIVSSVVAAQKKDAFPPQEFAKLRPLLCDADTLDELKAAGKTCRLDDFVVEARDLTGDGKPEWLFYGPSGLCGVHGNCPLNVAVSQGSRYALLGKNCSGENCLGWGNAYGSEVLNTTHNGYRDLEIASDAGSFYWSKSVYHWDGHAYKEAKGLTTYYLYDEKSDRLRKVSKERWDACAKSGKRCF